MRRLALTLGLLLATLPALAELPEGVEPVFLLANVEGKPAVDTATFWRDGEHWVAEAAQWQALGVVLTDAEQARALTAAELGVELEVDESLGTVEVVIPATRLPAQAKAPDRWDAPFAPVAPGVLVNYSLAASASKDVQGVSVGHEVRTGGAWGVLTTTGQANWTSSQGGDYIRGLTRWQKDDVARKTTYQVGDVVVVGGMGTVNLGGVRIARDPRALDPGTPTWPVPVLGGVALDPSTVSILANEAEVLRQDVGKGPFTIDRYGLNPGRNDTSVVVRDAFGREAVLSRQTLYFTQDVLRDGLTTWELAAGAVREGENDYGQRGASGSIAHGLTDTLTLRASAQVGEDNRNTTVGATTVLGTAGTLDVEVGKSRGAQGDGSRVAASYDFRGPKGGVRVEHERNDNFWRLAPERAPTIASRTSASVFYRPTSALRLRAGYSDTTTDTTRMRYADIGASLERGPHSLAASALYDLERRAPALEVGYRYSFGQRGSVGVTARKAPDVHALALQGTYRGEVAGQTFHAAAQVVDTPSGTSGQARVDMATSRGRAAAQVSVAPGGDVAVSGQFQGALYIGGRGVAMLPQAPSAYAVIDVPGQAGVPVRVGGRVVGETDKNGRLVVGDVAALVPTDIQIDDKALPLEVQVGETKKTLKATRGAGMHVVFPIQADQARSFTVVGKGVELVPGSVVKSSTDDTMLGFDGAVFLEHPEPGQRVEVVGVCAFELPVQLPAYGHDVAVECVGLPGQG